MYIYGWVNRGEGKWNDRLACTGPGQSEGGGCGKTSPTFVENAHYISFNTPFVVGIILCFLSRAVWWEGVSKGRERRWGDRDHRGGHEGLDDVSNQCKG